MPYVNGDFQRVWPSKMIDRMIEMARNGEDFSCEVYPGSVPQYYQALNGIKIRGKNALVIGSISPWIEVIMLSHDVSMVHTLEYHQLNCDHPLIRTYQNRAERDFPKKFDLVCSFSSIEHSGLGRYGEAIDPKGDLKAMTEIYEVLKPKGQALIGIPVAESNFIDSNKHRFYTKEYLEKTLFKRFNIESAIPCPFGADAIRYEGYDWQNQPLFCLRRS